MVRMICLLAFAATMLQAYPEFQKFSQTHSGRTVNCGMCHASPEGPDGLSFGQVGSLDSVQMELLKDARRAQQPGMDVNNPVLNPFGNKLVRVMGVRLLVDAKKDPAMLHFYLKDAGDMDGDGVTDAQEFLDGTNPNNRYHGDPLALFLTNVQHHLFEIVMIFMATGAGMFGLSNLLMAFAAGGEGKKRSNSV